MARSPRTPRTPSRNASPNSSASSPASIFFHLLLSLHWFCSCFFVFRCSIAPPLCSFFWGFWVFRASDKCQKEKRKTINGDDLLWAMATLGFEDYIEPLRIYLARYREVIIVQLLPFTLSVVVFMLILDVNFWLWHLFGFYCRFYNGGASIEWGFFRLAFNSCNGFTPYQFSLTILFLFVCFGPWFDLWDHCIVTVGGN